MVSVSEQGADEAGCEYIVFVVYLQAMQHLFAEPEASWIADDVLQIVATVALLLDAVLQKEHFLLSLLH